MFLCDENLNENYVLTEAYAKGKMASDYIAKIRQQCTLMTFVPGFTKAKINRLESLIEGYEDKLELAKKELQDYRSKSKTEQEKMEKLNKIDTILSTSIKIAVIILSIFITYVGAAKLAPIVARKSRKVVAWSVLTKNAEGVSKVKKIIAKLGGFGAGLVVQHAKTAAHVSNAAKLGKGVIKSTNEIDTASNTMKIGGYEAEIIKCIREMEQLLDVLKKKKTMFEMELEKKERNIT